MCSFSHLSLESRIAIQTGLELHKSFKAIAKELDVNCCTISREIRAHAVVQENPSAHARRRNKCVHAKECQLHHVCNFCIASTKRITPLCKNCKNKDCNAVCPDYMEKKCDRLTKPPYVCNGCPDKNKCRLTKKYYRAASAHKQYVDLLKSSREGFDLTEAEIAELNELLTPLVKGKKQSLYHVMTTHPDKFRRCLKTLYAYVNAGVLEVRPIDLPMAVRRKPRKRKVKEHKVDPKCRINRSFEDYLKYMEENPSSTVCQIDSVIGKVGGKCILTVFFPDVRLQIGILRNHNDAASVTEIFRYFHDHMNPKLFHTLFDVILTDNGSEFSNPSAIEALEDDGVHPFVFYCDPRHSEQKGACENNHINFRKIVPSGTSMDDFTQDQICLAFSHVNSLKRNSLNGKSAYEKFAAIYGKEALDFWGIRYIDSEDVVLSPSLMKDSNQISVDLKKTGEEHE